jgi:cyclomaltodextrinase / maltogenic alpha-amylase / neopullulanase
MTSWIDHTIWWHVYPLGFTGALGAGPGHRLGRLEPWLDYVVELGCNGLALGPVFASETHGYDTVDHFRIDPRLGDDTDFDALVTACHDRGLRVLLDGVFNHVGRSHSRPDWWRPDGATFEGHHQLVTLDHADPEVADHVVAVMDHWLDRGAAGWRLDAAYAVPRGFWASVGRGSAPPTPTPTSSARSSTATTPGSSPRPGSTRSPSTSCGRPSGARSTTPTCSSWPGPSTGTARRWTPSSR